MFVIVIAFGVRIYRVGGSARKEKAHWKKLDRILSEANFEGSYLLAKDGKILISSGRGDLSYDKKKVPDEKSQSTDPENDPNKIGRESTVAINSLTKQFTGVAGRYVPLKETIEGFKAIIDGEMDQVPELAFFNVGNLDDVKKKAESLKS